MAPIDPFAGQVTPSVPTSVYPVTQPNRPKVNADGSLNVDQSGNFTGSLSSVVVNITASGDNTVLAGTAAETISVYRAVLSSTGAVVITIKSGAATALSGPISLFTSEIMTLGFDGHPYWTTTNSTDALVINLSTTASLGGNIWLVQS